MRIIGDQGVGNLIAPSNFQAPPNAPRAIRGGRFRADNSEAPGPVEIFDEARWAKLNGSQLWALPLTTSTLVLPAPSRLRNLVGFRNNSGTGGANIYIEFGANASAASWLFLVPNTMVLLDETIPQDDVYAFADAANGQLVVVNSTTPGRGI